MSGDGDWRRLHPLSPVVRGGRGTIAVVIVLLPLAFGAGRISDAIPQLVIVGVLLVTGFVSWLVTRWRIEGDDLHLETGLLRRRSIRFPLSQLQAIDVVRPGLARLFNVAELRLRTAGRSGAAARLAYLPEHEVEPLRDRLLALARKARKEEAPAGEAEPAEEHVLTTVPTRRLIVSILISDVGIAAELMTLGLIVAYVVSPHAAAGIVSGGLVWILAVITLVWRRFNQLYKLTVAEAAEGLHLYGGLVALTAEVIRPGRVQAVRLVEPVTWRLLGWCRLEIDIAGRQRKKGEGQESRGQLRTLLPVAERALAYELLDRLVPDRPRELAPAPRRTMWKSPLRYRALAWARTDSCVATRSGRLRRVTCWVPLEKAQSLRYVQGPAQRRLRLASVHVDTAGRSVHASLRDRDVAEATSALGELTELARAARRRPAVV
ncbi:MAG TPA: PH domain-containing protein [Gaiellaceae bacterium]|nr:PH domain-containing protein [Gaiellaceae bacterium]